MRRAIPIRRSIPAGMPSKPNFCTPLYMWFVPSPVKSSGELICSIGVSGCVLSSRSIMVFCCSGCGFSSLGVSVGVSSIWSSACAISLFSFSSFIVAPRYR